MSKLVFDLSGNQGLTNRYQGDVDGVANTHLRYQDNDKLAEGIINPLRRSGFISASNTNYTELDDGVLIGSLIYDEVNDDIYASEIGTHIYRLDTPTDTTYTTVLTLADSVITDMDLYEVNGVKSLVYSHVYKEKVDTFKLGTTTGTKHDTWSIVDKNIGGFTRGITYGKGYFAATINASTGIYTSIDGKDWTLTATRNQTDGGSCFFLRGRFIFTSESGTNRIQTFDDLSSATETSTVGDTIDFKSGAYGAGMYVLVGNGSGSNHTVSSPQASVWTLRTTNTNNSHGVVYGGSQFVQVGSLGKVYTSPDGITWTSRTAAEANTWRSVAYGAGVYVAVSENGTNRVMKSADGITWTSVSLAIPGEFSENPQFRKVIFNDGVFIAVAENGIIAKSTDGSAWENVTSPVTDGIYDITYGNGYFAAMTDSGATIVSANLLEETSSTYNKVGLGFISLDTNDGLRVINSNAYELYPTTYGSQRLMWDFEQTHLSEYTKLGQRIYVGAMPERKIEKLRLGLISHVSENTVFRVSVYSGITPTSTLLYSTTFTVSSTDTPIFKDYFIDFGTQSEIVPDEQINLSEVDVCCIAVELDDIADTTVQGYVEWITTPPEAFIHEKFLRHSVADGWSEDTSMSRSFDFSVIVEETSEWTSDYITNNYQIDIDNQNTFIRKADNGFLYWFTDDSVHSVDGGITGGGTGILRRNLLVFPDYFTIVDAIDNRGKMYIAIQSITDSTNIATNANIAGVYIWDRLSTITNFRDFISIPGIRSIKSLFLDATGTINAICIGNDKSVQLRQYTGGAFTLVKTMGSSAYPRSQRGVSTINDLTYWFALDGHLYLYGSPIPNNNKELYRFAKLDTTMTDSGAVLTADNSSSLNNLRIFASYKTASEEGLKIYKPYDTNANFVAGNSFFTQVKVLPTLSTIKNIRGVHIPQTVSSTSQSVAEVSCYINMNSTPVWTKTITQDDINRGYFEKEYNKNNVNSIQFKVTWLDKALTVGDYCPMYFEVNYLDETRQPSR